MPHLRWSARADKLLNPSLVGPCFWSGALEVLMATKGPNVPAGVVNGPFLPIRESGDGLFYL